MLAADAEDAAPAGCVSGLTLERSDLCDVPDAGQDYKRAGESRMETRRSLWRGPPGGAELGKARATRELRHAPEWSIFVEKGGAGHESVADAQERKAVLFVWTRFATTCAPL